MKRILAPTDGSSHSRKALAFAADLAKRYDAELLVAHVTNETRITDDDRRLVETEYASEIGAALKRAEAQVAELGGRPADCHAIRIRGDGNLGGESPG